MPSSARYEIELRGLVTERILRPAVDDFRISPTEHGTTRLLGDVRDASHLNGLLVHFTSRNVDVVGLRRVDDPETPDPSNPATKGTTS